MDVSSPRHRMSAVTGKRSSSRNPSPMFGTIVQSAHNTGERTVAQSTAAAKTSYGTGRGVPLGVSDECPSD